MSEYPRIPIFSMRISQVPNAFIYLFRKMFRKERTFIFNGRKFAYFEHPYNRTWLNERAVEIPIVWDLMQKHSPSDVLEIGNVMSHYFQFGCAVVDKYEKGRGTIQQDVVDLALPERYGLIVTISTLEHVGWDETPRTADKHLSALENLKRHLSPGGLLVATLPIGYNSDLDEDLFAGRLGFDEVYYFKRMTKVTWRQAGADEVKDSKYGAPFRASNAFVIGFFHNDI